MVRGVMGVGSGMEVMYAQKARGRVEVDNL